MPLTSLGTPAVPPAKFKAGDTLIFRLAAQKDDLQKALAAINLAAKPVHGGFVEKAIADIKCLDRRQRQGPASTSTRTRRSTPVSAWHADDTMGGAMAKSRAAIAREYGTQLPLGWGLYHPTFSLGVDTHMTEAYAEVANAVREFSNVAPEMKPYQIGDMGGFRDLIRADLAKAAEDMIAGLDYARSPKTTSANGELVINGDFEKVPTMTKATGGAPGFAHLSRRT